MELLILTDLHNVAVLQRPASKTWAPPLLRLDNSFSRAASSKHYQSCMLGTCMSVLRFVSRVCQSIHCHVDKLQGKFI